MGEFWSKLLVVSGPVICWGSLATYANGVARFGNEMPREDSILFGALVIVGILALGYSVRKAFRSALLKVGIMTGALVLVLGVVILHWTGPSFYIVAGTLTAVLLWRIIESLRTLSPDLNP